MVTWLCDVTHDLFDNLPPNTTPSYCSNFQLIHLICCIGKWFYRGVNGDTICCQISKAVGLLSQTRLRFVTYVTKSSRNFLTSLSIMAYSWSTDWPVSDDSSVSPTVDTTPISRPQWHRRTFHIIIESESLLTGRFIIYVLGTMIDIKCYHVWMSHHISVCFRLTADFTVIIKGRCDKSTPIGV